MGHKLNVLEMLSYSNIEFVNNAYITILGRKPTSAETETHLFNLQYGLANKINILRHLSKSDDGKQRSVKIKGLLLLSIMNKAGKIPFVGYIFKTGLYIIYIPTLFNIFQKYEQFQINTTKMIQEITDDNINLTSEQHNIHYEMRRRTEINSIEQNNSHQFLNQRIDDLLNELNDATQNLKQRTEINSIEQNNNHQFLNQRINDTLNELNNYFQKIHQRIDEVSNEQNTAYANINHKIDESINELNIKFHEINDNIEKIENEQTDYDGNIKELRELIGRVIRANKRLEPLVKEKNEQLAGLWESLGKKEEQMGSLWKKHDETLDVIKKSNEQIDEIWKNLEKYDFQLGDLWKIIKKRDDSAAKIWKQINDTVKRLEFVREEILYEIQYSSGNSVKNQKKRKIEIINKKKYENMKKDVKVNIGCGDIIFDDYLNIDKRKLPNIDIITDADNLPFIKNTIAELYSSHLIEHFPQEEFRKTVLPYWYKLIKKGGKIRAVFPDFETMSKKYAKGDYPFEKFKSVIFGAQDYEGDFHWNMFSKDSIKTLLKEAGFKKISFPVTGRVNGDCYEMEVVAYK